MLNLRELVSGYHETASSYGELIPWFEQVTPGLVLSMDGALLAGFEFDGLDKDSTDEDELDAATQSLESAFTAFDHRNTLWTFLDKRRRVFINDSDIGHPVARMMEQEWLNKVDDGSLASFRHLFFIAYQPFRGTSGIFEEIGAVMTETGVHLGQAAAKVLGERFMLKAGIQRVEGKITSSISAFENQLTSFSQVLPRINVRRLEGNTLLAELSNRVNLASPRAKVAVPPQGPVYLNSLLTTDTVRRVDGGLLRFDGAGGARLLSMMSVKGYPAPLRNVDAEALLMVHGDFSIVHSYRFLDREGAKRLVMKAEQHYRSQVKGPITQIIEKVTGEESDRIDTGQLVLAEDAQAALVEITAENVNFGYHCMSVQVLGEDNADLQHTRKAIAAVLSNAGYGVVNEVIHQVGAFMATIPGAGDASVRATLVSTRNLADMAVVRSIHPGPGINKYLTEQRRAPSRSLCLFPTPSGVPELFNLHVGDVGHFMVVGPNGAGKTSLINLLIAMWQRYAPCRVIVLDKDKSCYLTIKALGGSYVSLTKADGNTSRMNPLRWIDDPTRWKDIARWIMGAMEAFGGEHISARQAQAINNAIAMSASAGAHGARRLGSFMTVLQGMDSEFAARLAPWVQSDSGASANYGTIFDNDHDAFAEQLERGTNAVIGIDVGGLLKDDRLAPSVLEYLFMSIDDLVDGRTPTLIYLEEAWYLLGNERFRAGFEDWIKTMRKRMGVVGLSTQSVEDIRRSGISSTLNDNIKTRIYLPNSQALASVDVYTQMLGLTNDHVQLIRALTPKRHYMIWQEGRTRVLDAFMPPKVLALTRSDALAREAFNRHLDQGGEDYVARYVKEITNA